MTFTYSSDDLKTWLKADAEWGYSWSFALNKMSVLGHTLDVEDLFLRNFDGTIDQAIVSTGASNRIEAIDWAKDAIREWAGNGATTNSLYFAKIARQFAINGPGKGDTARCLGTTLNFLHLFSRGASKNGSMDMLAPHSSVVTQDVTNIYCWIFTNKFNSINPLQDLELTAPIKGPAGSGPPGLKKKYWNSDGDGNPTGDCNEDQTHHFAAYFHFGAAVSVDKTDLHTALWRTHDWDPFGQKIVNKGDYDLGFAAAKLGRSYADRPRFIGSEIEKELN